MGGRGGARAGAGRKRKEPKDSGILEAAASLPVAPKDNSEQLFNALPLKQRNFVVNYLVNGFNATKAARDAGFSAKSADTQGSRLLANVKIKAVIAARTGRALAKKEITAENVLQEIAKMAFFDPRRLFRPDGTLIPITELDDDTAASIAGIDVSEIRAGKLLIGNLKKIKIADKGSSLERLGRHLKLFTDTIEHKGTLGVQLVHAIPRPKRDEPKK